MKSYIKLHLYIVLLSVHLIFSTAYGRRHLWSRGISRDLGYSRSFRVTVQVRFEIENGAISQLYVRSNNNNFYFNDASWYRMVQQLLNQVGLYVYMWGICLYTDTAE